MPEQTADRSLDVICRSEQGRIKLDIVLREDVVETPDCLLYVIGNVQGIGSVLANHHHHNSFLPHYGRFTELRLSAVFNGGDIPQSNVDTVTVFQYHIG